ncbi:MAG: alpha/beta hydrolase [Phycisphaerales bacterium]|nr:alpha/beta hydrolase [Phycisphaerales bacterium]
MSPQPPENPSGAGPVEQENSRLSGGQSIGRPVLRLMRSALLIYLGVCVGMGCLQDKIIFPGAASQGDPTAVVTPRSTFELIELRTRDGNRTFAVFSKASNRDLGVLPDASRRPTAILFYGNGAFLAQTLGDVDFFRTMGINVLAVEYVGYGMADGSPSERAFYATADAAYEHLIGRDDVDKNRILAIGMSIGSAAAIDLASRQPLCGLICFSPFTSLPAMGRYVMPWLPTSLILRYKFDNLTKIRSIRVPILIVHGRQDRTVPFFMSEQLAAAAGGKVTLLAYDQGDHNDIFEVGGKELEAQIAGFLQTFMP